jgi:hypothetical protein
MFRVEWIQSALDELARIWTQADPLCVKRLQPPVTRSISDSKAIRSMKENLDQEGEESPS